MFCLSHWSSNNEISYARHNYWLFRHYIASCFLFKKQSFGGWTHVSVVNWKPTQLGPIDWVSLSLRR
jgi:hypothetical protein